LVVSLYFYDNQILIKCCIILNLFIYVCMYIYFLVVVVVIVVSAKELEAEQSIVHDRSCAFCTEVVRAVLMYSLTSLVG
jgi:hypothetical protein